MDLLTIVVMVASTVISALLATLVWIGQSVIRDVRTIALTVTEHGQLIARIDERVRGLDRRE